YLLGGLLSQHGHRIVSNLNTVQILRNSASHLSLIYGKKFAYSPKMTEKFWQDFNYWGSNIDESKIDTLTHSLFSGLYTMKIFYSLMPHNEVKHWDTFVKKLNQRIQDGNYSSINNREEGFILIKGEMGFPKNWYDLLYIPNN
ncbi:MAG: hypothetical protein ABF712_12685, partial [Liquorilactobacillus hordei]